MHRLLLAISILFSLSASAQQKLYNPSIDVQHYRFDIKVSDDNDTLKGRAAITVRFTEKTGLVYLDLKNINDAGKGMVVNSVSENDRALSFSHHHDSLLIGLAKDAITGETKQFTINYSGIPADGLIFSKNKAGERTIFGDNWPNRGRNWLPCKDHLSDKASVEFIVTAPSHYRVVSNGLKQEETKLPGDYTRTHWKETAPIPTKIMVIGLADFAVSDQVMANDIPVTSWIFHKQKEAGFYDYAPAAEILRFFNDRIGPYAYQKLANVQSNTIFGGMENAGAIFYAESSVTGKQKIMGLLAHEIAHQWFGDAATEKDWPHIWLSEGFATEMSQLYLEHKYGADTMTSMLKKNRKTILAFTKKEKVPVVDTSKGKEIMKLLNTNSYQKGGWVLHMLRRELGDELFWKCIRTYYATYRNSNASSSDLQQVMEKVSGKNMDVFFKQWLYVPENPTLDIVWNYDDKNKQVTVRVKQQTGYVFSVPLELQFVDGAGNKTMKTVRVSEKTNEYILPVNSKPALVEVDPNCKLLFEVSISPL